MAGIAQGLIGSIKTASASAGNLVLNSSFTSSVSGWQRNISRNTSIYKSAPASLRVDGDADFETIETLYSRTGCLTIGQAYSLSVWVKASDYNNDISVFLYAGTAAKSTSMVVTTSASWVQFKVENLVCTGNTNLLIDILAVDDAFYIDDVVAVAGSTAP